MNPQEQMEASAARYGLEADDLLSASSRSDIMAARRHFAGALYEYRECGRKVYSTRTIARLLRYKTTSSVLNLLGLGRFARD